jgi:hypothetical protein
LADEEALVFQCQMVGRIWKGAAGMYRRSEGRTRGLGVGGAEVFDGERRLSLVTRRRLLSKTKNVDSRNDLHIFRRLLFN